MESELKSVRQRSDERNEEDQSPAEVTYTE